MVSGLKRSRNVKPKIKVVKQKVAKFRSTLYLARATTFYIIIVKINKNLSIKHCLGIAGSE